MKKGYVRRLLSLLLACVLMLSTLAAGASEQPFASDLPGAAGRYARPELATSVDGLSEKAPKVVRVGYFDYGGFLDKDETGAFSGYGYEYLAEIANYVGWRCQFVYGTWNDLLRKLADGEIDLLCIAQYTNERAALFEYSKYEMGVEYTALYVSRENENIYFNDVESLQGIHVAMVRGTYQNGLFEQYARIHNIDFTKQYFNTFGEAERALKRGDVDGLVAGSLRHTNGEKVVLKFSPDPFFFITTKGNRAVMDAVNAAMEEIRTWDVNYNARLYDKYYGADVADQLAFTRDEAEYIQGRGPLRVVYNTSWMPLSYRESNEAKGILIQLMNAVAEKSGLSFTFVPAGSVEEMTEFVRQGKADMVCFYPSERIQAAREDQLLLTKTEVTVPVSMVWRRGSIMSRLKRAAVPKSQVDLARLVKASYPEVSIVFCKDADDCLKAVVQNRADAAFENTYIMTQLLKNYETLETVPAATVQYPLSIAISTNENPALLTALNKTISQISSAEINNAILDYTVQAMDLHNSLYLLRRYLPIVLLIIAGIILALVLRSKRLLERFAFIDPLTGHMNQTKFVVESEKRIRDKYDGYYAIMCFDIDRFKVINDIHGYQTGNVLLKDISKTLEAHLTTDEIFCRTAGDNYVLLLVNVPAMEQKAAFLVERVCDVATGLDANIQYTVSAGLYAITEPVGSIHIAIDRANLARQTVKGAHQNPVAFYTETMRRKVLREQELENRMDGALANQEFLVYYQPKFTVSGQKVVGAEALVRWRTADGVMIYPDEFIPVFETSGMIIQLDLYVFERVCEHLRSWLDMGLDPYPVSVNLSRVHLYQQNFYEDYLVIMHKYRIPAYLVELELTESTMFENQQQLVQVMERLKSLGILISMDDFGSGYSSLNLLKDLPIDSLKIDREFFNQSTDTQRGQKIIRSVVAMARQLDILVVSEGVETQEQVDFLRAINCQVAQGFYFSKPLPMEEYEKLAFGSQLRRILKDHN